MAAPVCADCRHMRFGIAGHYSRWCARSISMMDIVTGEQVMRSCESERSLGWLFRSRCGASGRHFEPKPCGGPVQFNWSEPPLPSDES